MMNKIIGVVIVLLTLGFGGWEITQAVFFIQEGHEVTGTVVDHSKEYREGTEDSVGHDVYCPVVEFSLPDGSTFHEVEGNCDEDKFDIPDEGESVTVSIQGDDPETASVGPLETNIWFGLVKGILASVMGLLFGTGMVFKWSRNA